MSKTIDQKVVEMQFDNKQFEKNISTSMTSIEKLKERLNFSGVSKGFDNISASAKKVNISPLSSAVETVTSKFSALEVMGITALANITNSAVNAGKRIVSALTIDPIMTGFQEYETQMNAVQTILANTSHQGTTLQDVTAALNELNTYADKTIYNFTEMTKNIGTFTAAGLDLNTSVQAIKGIANLAAVSGSTSQQASTAMYQLSQALAAGTVSLQDWNSVVNAGMGGKVFQDALIRTAAAMQGVTEEAFRAKNVTTSFRESINAQSGTGWLTGEVLSQTLRQFTGDLTDAELAAMGFTDAQIKNIQQMAVTANDAATKVKTFTQLWDTMKEAAQSGWAQTWQMIFGDFEEAKEFFTELSEIFTGDNGLITKMSNARNAFLGGALTSNWDKLIEQVNDAGVATEDFTEQLEKNARATVKNYDEIIKKNGSLAKAFMSGDLKASIIVDTLKKMAGATDEASKATGNMTDKLEYFQKVVDKVWNGDYKNGEERIKALADAGYNYAEVQKLINKTVDGHKLTLEELSDVQLKSIGYTDQEVSKLRELAEQAEKTGTPLNELIENMTKPSGRELLIDSFMTSLKSLIAVFGAVGKAWQDIFPPMTSDRLYAIIEAFNKFIKSLEPSTDTLDKITRSFRGLFAILDIITTITGGAFKMAFKALTTVLGMFDMDVLDLTANMGDAIVAFRDWLFEGNALAKGLANTTDVVKKVVKGVQDFVKLVLDIPEVQSALSSFDSMTNKVLGNVRDYFSEGMERISDFIEYIQSLDSISLDDLGKILSKFKDDVIDYFLDFGSLFDNIAGSLKNFRDNAADAFEGVHDAISKYAPKIGDFLTMLNDRFGGLFSIGGLLMIGVGAGLIIFIKKLGDALQLISSPILAFSDVMEGLGGVLRSYSLQIKAEALKQVAIAIGILAASIALLTLLDMGKMWSAVGALVVLSAGLLGFTTALSALNKFGGTIKGTASFAGLAAGIMILVLALKVMEGLNPDTLLNNVAVLGIIAVGLATVVGVLSKLAPSLSQGALTFVAFAIGLKLIVGALEDLEDIKLTNIGDTIALLLTTFVGLALVSKAANGLKLGSGISVVATVVALNLLIGSIEKIAEMDANKILNNLDAFVTIFGMFAGLMVSSHFAGKNAATAGVGILAMSTALLIMVPAIKGIAAIDPTDMSRAIDAINGMLLVFGVLTALSKFSGQNAAKAGLMILEMSAALVLISGAMMLLAQLDPDGLNRALGVITVLELLFGGLIAVTKLADGANAPIVKMTITIGLLAAAVGLLSFIEPERLATATASLSAVMAMFALLVASTSLAKSANGTLIVMTVVVAALAGILYTLGSLPIGSTLEVAASLSLLLTSLSASMLILSNTSSVSPTAYATLGVMTLVVAGLAVIIGTLASLDVGPTLEIAVSLSTLLLSLSAACAILALVGTAGASAFVGIGALATLIVGIGGLMAGIGALATYYPALEEFLDTGIVILEKIGSGIGNFVGNILGGILEGVTAGLPGVADNLSEFMLHLQPFLTGVKMINDDMVKNVMSLATMILTLTATDLINGIAMFFGGGSSLSKFAEQLVPFGNAMVTFSSTVSGKIDEDAVTAAANAGVMLSQMASNLPREGGFLNTILGSSDLENFSKQLKTFGKAIAEFSKTVEGKVSEAAVEAAANSGMALSELAGSLPRDGGALQDFLGSQNLEVFGKQLKAFGKAIVEFSQTVAGKVSEEAVTAAANSGMAMAELANNLPKQNGALQDFFGEQDLEVFGEQLKAFGKAIVEFSKTVEGNVSEEAVTAAANAGATLSELNSKLPKQNGFFQNLFGEQDLGVFGEQLKLFGSSFSEYSKSMESVKPEVLSSTTTAADAIVKLANSLPETGWFSNATTIDDFGAQLAKFGGHFQTYYTKISEVNTTKLSKVIDETENLIELAKGMSGIDSDAISNFGKSLKKLGDAGVEDFIDTFDNSKGEVQKAATGMLDTFISAANNYKEKIKSSFVTIVANTVSGIQSKASNFKVTGSKFIEQLVSGITSKSTAAKNSVSSIADSLVQSFKNKSRNFNSVGVECINQFINGIKSKQSAVNTSISTDSIISSLKDHYNDFYNAGAHLGGGFANGLRSQVTAAANAATSIAQSAVSAAKNKLQIKSPSRVGYEIGDYFGIGFVNAVIDHVDQSYKASSEMAGSAVSGLKDTVSKLSRVVEADLDTQPTIRPVLDLSDVENGTKKLSALFSRDQAVAISASRSRSTVESSQNGVVQTDTAPSTTFVQNNYSPKALSRVEIYRQTNNLLSSYGRKVRA